MDLKHNGYDDIHQNEHHDNPKWKEESFDVPWVANDDHEDVDNDEPVVDYHLLEENHQGGAEIIEIHQPVQIWSECVDLSFIDLEGELAVEENHSHVSILIENKVDEEEPGHNGLREVEDSLPDELHILDDSGVFHQSNVPQGEDYAKVLQLMSQQHVVAPEFEVIVKREDEVEL